MKYFIYLLLINVATLFCYGADYSGVTRPSEIKLSEIKTLKTLDNLVTLLKNKGFKVNFERVNTQTPVNLPEREMDISQIVAILNEQHVAKVVMDHNSLDIRCNNAPTSPLNTILPDMHLNDVTGVEALKAIAKSTGVPLSSIVASHAAQKKKISLNLHGVSIREALTEISNALGENGWSVNLPDDGDYMHAICGIIVQI